MYREYALGTKNQTESAGQGLATFEGGTSKTVLITAVVTSGLWLVSLGVLWWTPFDSKFDQAFGFGLAVVAWLALVWLTTRQVNMTKLVLALMVVGGGAAVIAMPATSTDVNSYAMYGQMVSEHHASPYVHSPDDFPQDLWSNRVAGKWKDSPSLYGPLFTGLSAALVVVTGGDVEATVHGFQLLALVAYALSAYLLWRRSRNTSVLAFFGLSPFVLALGVNDAHSDLLVGLGVLCAALLIERAWNAGSTGVQRLCLAGVSLACAGLVKITALLAAGGSALVLVARRRLRNAALLVFIIAVTVGIGLTIVGVDNFVSAMSQASDRHSRFSLWAPVHSLLNESGQPDVAKRINAVANLVVLVVGALVVWMLRKNRQGALWVVAPLVTYQVLGPYTVGWYALWSLPALALVRHHWLTKVAVGHGVLVTMLYFLL